MKYLKLFLAAVALLFSLISCTVNQHVTYYSDGAQSALVDMDIRELVQMIPPEQGSEMTQKLKEMPTVWTPLKTMLPQQDMKEQKLTAEQEAVLSKMMVRANREGENVVGISYKMDRVSEAQMAALEKAKNTDQTTKMPAIPMSTSAWHWDGKNLRLDMALLNFNDLIDSMSKEMDDAQQDAQTAEELPDPESIKQMIGMLLKRYSLQMHFEKPIKSITGSHPWVKKVDNHTIEINVDLNDEKQADASNSSKTIVVSAP